MGEDAVETYVEILNFLKKELFIYLREDWGGT